MDLEILNMSMKGLTEMPDLFELLHKLKILYCSNNDLKFLNMSNNIGLIRLDCYSNKLKDLDLSKNIMLEQLYCDNNLLKYLNLTENTELEQLHCYNNLLETLDVSNNIKLIRLICNGNPNLSQIIAKKGESLYKENIVKDPHTEIIWV
jgi:Leucine-rich repeat (LRR) protein